MAGAPLGFPSQSSNIYAYGKAKSLQVLPDAVAPLYALHVALARRGHDTVTPRYSTPLSTAQAKGSARAHTMKKSRKHGAPPRIRGYSTGGGYGAPTG